MGSSNFGMMYSHLSFRWNLARYRGWFFCEKVSISRKWAGYWVGENEPLTRNTSDSKMSFKRGQRSLVLEFADNDVKDLSRKRERNKGQSSRLVRGCRGDRYMQTEETQTRGEARWAYRRTLLGISNNQWPPLDSCTAGEFRQNLMIDSTEVDGKRYYMEYEMSVLMDTWTSRPSLRRSRGKRASSLGDKAAVERSSETNSKSS